MGSNTEKKLQTNIQKNNIQKLKKKRLRVTTFAIAKLEER